MHMWMKFDSTQAGSPFASTSLWMCFPLVCVSVWAERERHCWARTLLSMWWTCSVTRAGARDAGFKRKRGGVKSCVPLISSLSVPLSSPPSISPNSPSSWCVSVSVLHFLWGYSITLLCCSPSLSPILHPFLLFITFSVHFLRND